MLTFLLLYSIHNEVHLGNLDINSVNNSVYLVYAVLSILKGVLLVSFVIYIEGTFSQYSLYIVQLVYIV